MIFYTKSSSQCSQYKIDRSWITVMASLLYIYDLCNFQLWKKSNQISSTSFYLSGWIYFTQAWRWGCCCKIFSLSTGKYILSPKLTKVLWIPSNSASWRKMLPISEFFVLVTVPGCQMISWSLFWRIITNLRNLTSAIVINVVQSPFFRLSKILNILILNIEY